MKGEYILQEVREMASGFLLKPDHTFEFFFAYGALDRFATGNWKEEGYKIIFNTRKWPGSDFTLVSSEPGEKDSIIIEFQQNNPMLSAYVYASLANGAANTWERFDQRGYVRLPLQAFDAVSLIFEFCPERFSRLPVSNRDHHKFIIRAEQTLAELYLEDFNLSITESGLKGKHPLMQGEEFVYEK